MIKFNKKIKYDKYLEIVEVSIEEVSILGVARLSGRRVCLLLAQCSEVCRDRASWVHTRHVVLCFCVSPGCRLGVAPDLLRRVGACGVSWSCACAVPPSAVGSVLQRRPHRVLSILN
jgi:hypothetical protein